MNEVGRLARVPSSRVTKWFVVGFWIVVLGLLFAGRRRSCQACLNNEAASWLPEDAQSTQVVKQIADFQSTNEFPAVIVYERAGGITPADLAAVSAQVAKFNALEPVKRDAVGPIPSADEQGAAGHRPGRRGRGRLGLARHHRRPDAGCREGHSSRALDAHHRPGRLRRRLVRGVLRASTASCSTARWRSSSSSCSSPTAARSSGSSRSSRRAPRSSSRRASSTSWPTATPSPSTRRAPASSRSSSSAPAPTTRCCSSRATARSCGATRTGTRRWRSRCTAPVPPSSPPERRSSPACSACSSRR